MCSYEIKNKALLQFKFKTTQLCPRSQSYSYPNQAWPCSNFSACVFRARATFLEGGSTNKTLRNRHVCLPTPKNRNVWHKCPEDVRRVDSRECAGAKIKACQRVETRERVFCFFMNTNALCGGANRRSFLTTRSRVVD